MSNQWIKDPTADLDYEIDWSQWLRSGDTLTSSTWVISPTGLTQQSAYSSPTSTTIWLTGGTVGISYTVTNRITTAQGRDDERSLTIQVLDR